MKLQEVISVSAQVTRLEPDDAVTCVELRESGSDRCFLVPIWPGVKVGEWVALTITVSR